MKTAEIWNSYLNGRLGANEAQAALAEISSRTASSLIMLIQLDRNVSSLFEDFRVPDGADDRIAQMTKTSDVLALALSKRSIGSSLLDLLPKPSSVIQPEVFGTGTADSDGGEAKRDKGHSKEKA